MSIFSNLFTATTSKTATKSAKTKEAVKFEPLKPELYQAIQDAFNQEMNAVQKEALNAIALSFTSGRSTPVMNFAQLTYWLENDCEMQSIKKNWPKIVGWWIKDQGVHVRKESGKQTGYKNLLPDSFYPVHFFDSVPAMLDAIKQGNAMVYSPKYVVLCKASEAQEAIKPQAKVETPKAKVETPKAKVETPKAKVETPKAKVETPKAKS